MPPRIRASVDSRHATNIGIVLITIVLLGGSVYHFRDRSHFMVMSGRTLQGAVVTMDSIEGRGMVQVRTPIHDMAIVGAGPAGLTAALFGARAGLDVLVLGSETGLLSETQHLDNFPSYLNGNGPDWLTATKQQALQFGAKFATPGVLATKLYQREKTLFALTTTASESSEEATIYAWSVIVATGATPRHLGLAKEEYLWGKYLHNCAICDGHLYRGKTVLVVGGGDSAMDAALLLSRYAEKVYLVHRRMQWSGKNSAAVQVARQTFNIEFVQPYEVEEWQVHAADNVLIGARLRHAQDHQKEERVLSIDGAFVMIGAGWLKGMIDLTKDGLVKLVGPTKTSMPGIFAVGEVADDVYKQAITASAAGAQAAIDAERWLRETRGIDEYSAVVIEPTSNSHQLPPKATVKEQPTPKVVENEIDCDLTKEDCISQLVKKHPVVVFSKAWCPFCRKAREALSAAGIPDPFIVDLTNNDMAAQIQGTLGHMTGRRTVPNVFIGGKSIGGGDETAGLQARGKLIPLLVQGGALVPPPPEKQDSNRNDKEGEGCDLAVQSCIEEIIHKYPVVMFSLAWCPECKRTLELFHSIGANRPHIVDLDDYSKEVSQQIRYHMLNISGRRSVPNLYIDGEFFGGYLQTLRMHEEGLLVPKLQQVGWIT